MKADETINNILQEVQQELREEDGIDLSTAELFSIANSQFIAGALAVNKRISFFFGYIGGFILKNKRAYIESVKSVKALKGTIPDEEYMAIVKEKRIANFNGMNGARLEVITELKDLPNDLADNQKIKGINKLYKEIIEQA
tara:strand:+ start:59565 stop:59987 length:423 start_codon:yes stop_codon:yes gene_type:complete